MKFDIHFSGSHKKFFSYYFRWFITSLAYEKCKKECIMLYIIVHWKSKLLNVLGDFVLNCSRRTFCKKYSTGGPWGACCAKRHNFFGFSPNVQCPSKSFVVAWKITADLLCVTTPFSAITFGWLNWPMIDASDRKSFWFFSFEPG